MISRVNLEPAGKCDRALAAIFFALSLAAPVSAASDRIRFVDIAASASVEFHHISGPAEGKRYLFETKGGGIAFVDYDNDGLQDLFIVQGSTVENMLKGENPHSELFRNLGGGRFRNVSEQAGITSRGWGMGVACGDYDNDGFTDILVTQLGQNLLYRNNGDGTFTERARAAGIGPSPWSTSAAFGDYDGDGDLDLYVCAYVDVDFRNLPEPGSASYCQYRGKPDLCGPMGLKALPNVLYRNNGDGTFTDVTAAAGVDETNRYYSLGVIWSDLDNDGDLDLLVGNDSGPNCLYVNRGDGGFDEMGFLSGLAASGDGRFQASMGIDSADYDNDGLLDVFMTHFANDYSTLYLNRGKLLFEDVTAKALLVQPGWLWVSWGTRFLDVDLDGWKDIFHSNGHVYPFLIQAGWSEEYAEPSSLYLNQHDGTFKDWSAQAGEAVAKKTVGRGAAFGDFDNDGDMDIAKANLNGEPQLLRNDSETDNHWVMFLIRGKNGNRDGIGARIKVRTGDRVQLWEVKRTVGIYSSSDPRAHFGLGGSPVIDEVEVRWLNGQSQTFRDVPADRHYLIEESGGIEPQPIRTP